MDRRSPSRASTQLARFLSYYGAASALAREIGASPQLVSDWRTGFRRPSVKWMAVIERRLGIPMGDWLEPCEKRRLRSVRPDCRRAS